MNKISQILIFCSVGVLCSCAVDPDFEKPNANLPNSWSVKQDGRAFTDDKTPRALSAEELSHWWTVFGDEQLSSLISRAFKGNLTLADAKTKIAQARANLGVVQSGLLPSLDARTSFAEGGKTIGSEGQSFAWGASTNWELDLFGGTRRMVEARVASYKESLASSAAARIAVAAEVAKNYFEYRAIQQQIEIVKDNLQTQIKTYNVTNTRRENGFVSRLDVVRAKAQVEATRAQLPRLESELTLRRHSLEYLLGLQTGELKKELSPVRDLPELENFIPLGTPAKLVERRPDIIAAEYALHAATAQIGNAKADFYPKFYISGEVSYTAPNVGDMVANRFGSWSVGPKISWNLFQGGKTVFNVQLQRALEEAAGISWKSTVLTALKEVEDSIVSAAKERERIAYLNSIVHNTKQAYELSLQLYTEGNTEFIDLLDAQRAMLDAQQNRILARQLFINHVVSLYKSLGGGWTDEDIVDTEMQDSFLELYLDEFFARENAGEDSESEQKK